MSGMHLAAWLLLDRLDRDDAGQPWGVPHEQRSHVATLRRLGCARRVWRDGRDVYVVTPTGRRAIRRWRADQERKEAQS